MFVFFFDFSDCLILIIGLIWGIGCIFVIGVLVVGVCVVINGWDVVFIF